MKLILDSEERNIAGSRVKIARLKNNLTQQELSAETWNTGCLCWQGKYFKNWTTQKDNYWYWTFSLIPSAKCKCQLVIGSRKISFCSNKEHYNIYPYFCKFNSPFFLLLHPIPYMRSNAHNLFVIYLTIFFRVQTKTHLSSALCSIREVCPFRLYAIILPYFSYEYKN